MKTKSKMKMLAAAVLVAMGVGSAPMTALAVTTFDDGSIWGNPGSSNSVVGGIGNNAGTEGSSAFGIFNNAANTGSTAVGYYSQAVGAYSTAIGYNSYAGSVGGTTGTNSIGLTAIGFEASASDSRTDTEKKASYSTVISTVSFGHQQGDLSGNGDSYIRSTVLARLINVADGRIDELHLNDAATTGQLIGSASLSNKKLTLSSLNGNRSVEVDLSDLSGGSSGSFAMKSSTPNLLGVATSGTSTKTYTFSIKTDSVIKSGGTALLTSGTLYNYIHTSGDTFNLGNGNSSGTVNKVKVGNTVWGGDVSSTTSGGYKGSVVGGAGNTVSTLSSGTNVTLGIGNTNSSTGVVVGRSNSLTQGGIAFGNSNSLTQGGIAFGDNNTDTGLGGLLIGQGNANATYSSSVAVGINNNLKQTGNGVEAVYSVALGADNTTEGGTNIAIGYQNTVATKLGDRTTYTPYAALGVGVQNEVYGKQSLALGFSNTIGTSGSADTAGKQTIAIGLGNKTQANNAVLIGSNITTAANNSVVLGVGSTSEAENTVSVGNTTTQRKIVHVADGTAATDAATYGQVLAVSDKMAKTGQTVTLSKEARSSTDTSKYNTIVSNDGTVVATFTPSTTQAVLASTTNAPDTGFVSGAVLHDYTTPAAVSSKNDTTGVTGSLNLVSASENVGKNLSLLDEKIGTLSANGNVIGSANTISQNLKLLDAAVGQAGSLLTYDSQTKLMQLAPNLDSTGINVGTSATALRKVSLVADGTKNTDVATYGQIATAGQSIEATTISNKNVIVNNKDAALATFTITTDDSYSKKKAEDTGFVSGGFLYSKLKVASNGTYVKMDNTVGANLLALDAKIGKTSSTVSSTSVINDENTIFENLEALEGKISTNDSLVSYDGKNKRIVLGSTDMTNAAYATTLAVGGSIWGSVPTSFSMGEENIIGGSTNNVTAASAGIAAIGIGNTVSDGSSNSDVFGFFNTVKVTDSNIYGSENTVYGSTDTVVGKGNTLGSTTADVNYSGAFGSTNTINGSNTYVIGYNNNTGTAANTYVFGSNNTASASNAILIGSGISSAAANSVVIGDGSESTRANTVSVGSSTLKRKIVNVAYGEANNEVATYGQLIKGTEGADVKTYKADSSGIITLKNNDDTTAFKIDLNNGSVTYTGSDLIDVTYDSEKAAKVISVKYMDIDGTGYTAGKTDTVATGQNATAVGVGATTNGSAAIALGYNAKAGQLAKEKTETEEAQEAKIANQAIAIGNSSSALALDAISIGDTITASKERAVAIGNYSEASGIEALALGTRAKSTGQGSGAVGTGSEATADNAYAIGPNSKALALNAYAVGPSAESKGKYAAAIGSSTKAYSDYAMAVGFNTEAGSNDTEQYLDEKGETQTRNKGIGAMAIGREVKATGTNSVAVGVSSTATAEGSAAIGIYTNATAAYAYAIGPYSQATAQGAYAVGYGAVSSNVKAVSVGQEAAASGVASFAAGTKAKATGDYSYAVGEGAQATADYAAAVGYGAEASGIYSIAAGYEAKATNEYAVATGHFSEATGKDSMAVGYHSISAGEGALTAGFENTASGKQATAVGTKSVASADEAIALGFEAKATAESASSLGHNAEAHGKNSLAIGDNTVTGKAPVTSTDASTGAETVTTSYAETYGKESVAIGMSDKVTGNTSFAYGNSNTIEGSQSGAFGYTNKIYGAGSYAIGNTITIGATGAETGANTFVLGSNVKTTASNAVILGANSTATVDNVVSVGSASATRKIINVTDGTESSDAATYGQLIKSGQKFTFDANTTTAEVKTNDNKTAFTISVNPSALSGYKAGTEISIDEDASNPDVKTINVKATGAIASGNTGVVTGDTVYQYLRNTSSLVEYDATNSLITIGKNDDIAANTINIAGYDTATKTNTVTRQIQGVKAGTNLTDAANVGQTIGIMDGKSTVETYTINAENRTVTVKNKNGEDAFSIKVESSASGGSYSGSDTIAIGSDENNTLSVKYMAAKGKTGETAAATTATGDYAMAWGVGSNVTGEKTLAIGYGNTVTMSGTDKASVAIGSGNSVTAGTSFAYGTGNNISGAQSGGFGDTNAVSAAGSYAIGNNNTVGGAGTFVLGSGINSTAANSVILGAGSTATESNVVSVGASGATRKIINVTAGTANTDAATVGQTIGAGSNGKISTYAINSNTQTVTVKNKDGSDAFTLSVATGSNYKGSDTIAITTDTDGSQKISVKYMDLVDNGLSQTERVAASATGDGSLAWGVGAVAGSATTAGAVAIGYKASGTGQDSLAIGKESAASAENAISLGDKTKALASGAIAVGHNSTANSAYSFVLGDSANATGTGAAAIGNNSTASADYAYAIGPESKATQEYAYAVGYSAQAGGAKSAAIGYGAIASGEQSIAAGISAQAQGKNSVAVGHGSVAGEEGSIALGHASTVSGKYAMTAGFQNTASADYASAIGGLSSATGLGAIAVGISAKATATYATALGHLTNAYGNNSIAMGHRSVIGKAPETDKDGKVTKDYAAEYGVDSVAVGIGTIVEASNAFAFGNQNEVYAKDSGAFGDENKVYGVGSYAFGDTNVIGAEGKETGKATFVMGSNVDTTADYSVVLGYNSSIDAADGNWVVSVGSESQKRKIIHVADGVADSDAATVGQLNKSISANTYTGDGKTVQISDKKVISAMIGEVSGSSEGVIDGKTAYTELRPADGTVVKQKQTTAQNLTALNGAIDTLNTEMDVQQGLISQDTDNVIHIGQGSGVGGTEVSFAQANGTKRKLSGITAGTDAGEAATYEQLAKTGQEITLENNKNSVMANDNATKIATFSIGSVALNNTGFISGGTLYTEVRPQDGTYVKTDNTTGANLKALDDQIVKNVSNIEENHADIDKLETGVKTNAAAIQANKDAIQTNADAIADNKKLIDQNTTKITNLTTDLNTVKGDVADNKTAISTNASSIQTIQGNITTIQGDITTIQGDVTTVQGDVSNLQDAITLKNDGNWIKTSNSLSKNLLALDDAISSGGSIDLSHFKKVTKTENANVNEDVTGAIALGEGAYSGAQDSIAIGTNSNVTGQSSIAIGTGHQISGNNSGAFGDPTKISGDNSYSVGNDNEISTKGTFVLGNKVTKTANNSVILGNESEATEEDVISVGSSTHQRKIVNVAQGTADTDAVNVGQLKSMIGNISSNNVTGENSTGIGGDVKVEGNNSTALGSNATVQADKSVAIGSGATTTKANSVALGANSTATEENVVSVGNEQQQRRITNVAEGVKGTDAANVDQVRRMVDGVSVDINKVGAGAAALAALHPEQYDPNDKLSFAVGYGHYKNANAGAIGAYYKPNQDTTVSIGSTFGNGDPMMNLGVSFKLGTRGKTAGVYTSNVELVREMNAMKSNDELQNKKINAQQKRIETLEAKNARLEADNAKIKADNEKMKVMMAKILKRMEMSERVTKSMRK